MNNTPNIFGLVAQLGERRVRNAEVKGSIPSGSTTLRRRLWISHSGAKLWDTPVNNRGVPLFWLLWVSLRDRAAPFLWVEEKAILGNWSIVPFLTRMFLSAPLFPEMTRIELPPFSGPKRCAVPHFRTSFKSLTLDNSCSAWVADWILDKNNSVDEKTAPRSSYGFWINSKSSLNSAEYRRCAGFL